MTMKHYLTPSADLIYTQPEDIIVTSITYGDSCNMDDETVIFSGIKWPGKN